MRKFIGSCIAFVILAQSNYPALAAWPQCPVARCGETCRQTDGADSPIFVAQPAGSGQFCYCTCSCVAADTLVQTGANEFRQLGQLAVGDSIVAMRSDGTWSSALVGLSGGTQQPSKTLPYVIFVATANGTSLIATPAHVFMLGDKTLKRADRLLPSDRLMDAKSFKPTAIERLHSGSYFGPVHNVAVGEWNESEAVDGHLINTAGVVSGDYLAQVELEADATTPQVGSDEHREKYAADLRALNGTTGALRPLVYKAGNSLSPKTSDSSGRLVLDEKKGWEFVAYSPVEVPEDAFDLLAPEDRIAKTDLLHALDYTVPHDTAMSVIERFRRAYPDVVFKLDWNTSAANAKAYVLGGRAHVLLMGGFIRHPAIQVEGVELIISHEIGHHYGGHPRYVGKWASCEGQSDYWGAKVAMRKVWPGPDGPARTERGAQQVYDFLITRQLRPRTDACDLPLAQCRLDTWRAAALLAPKPACASAP